MIIRRLLFCCIALLSLDSCYCNTFTTYSFENSYISPIDSMDRETAERHLLLGESSFKKAKSAMIASVLTLGLFYILAFFWLVVALYHLAKAYKYFKTFASKSKEFAQAQRLLQKAVSLAILHLFLIIGIILFGTGVINFIQSSSFFTTKNVAIIAILMLFICDLLFFKIIFFNKNS